MGKHGSKLIHWLNTGCTTTAACVLWALSGLFFSNHAQAREWLGLPGAELGENHNAYAFAGVITPLASNAALGQGWVQRYWLDWVEYRFDSNNETVRAEAPGFSAAVGYQQATATGFWAGYAGAGYRKTTLSPDRPDAEVRGSQTALHLLVELDHRFAKTWRFAGAAQLALGPDSYWTRAKFLNKSSDAAFWQGAEIVFQGDPDYHATKVGYVLDEWSVGKGIGVNLKLGANKTKGVKTAGYVGIEFVGSFGNR